MTEQKIDRLTITLHTGSREHTISVPIMGDSNMHTLSAASPGRDWADLQREYLEWGAAFGGKDGRAWAPKHQALMAAHLTRWQVLLKVARLDEITAAMIERELARVRDSLSPKTAQHYYEALRSFVTWSLKRDYLASDPMKAVRKPNGDAKRVRRAMTPAECVQLLNACHEHRKLLYKVALATGLRYGELKQLTWQMISSKGITLPPHVTKARREECVPLPDELLDELLIEKRALEVDDDSREVFFTLPRNAAREFKRDLKRAGIAIKTPEGALDFHALRTTAITLAESEGCRDSVVRAFGRHTTSVASARYRKATDKDVRAAQAAVWSKIDCPSKHQVSGDVSRDDGLRTCQQSHGVNGPVNPNAELMNLLDLARLWLTATPEHRAAIWRVAFGPPDCR